MPDIKIFLLQPTARQMQKITSSTTLTASSMARRSAIRSTGTGHSTWKRSFANDCHFLSEVLFGAGGLPAAPFAHFANVFRYGSAFGGASIVPVREVLKGTMRAENSPVRSLSCSTTAPLT